MPRQDVDGAAFAIDVERRLRHSLPRGATQEREELLDEVGVVAIKEAVGGLSLPIDAHHEPGVECFRDALEREDTNSARPTSLDPCDQRL